MKLNNINNFLTSYFSSKGRRLVNTNPPLDKTTFNLPAKYTWEDPLRPIYAEANGPEFEACVKEYQKKIDSLNKTDKHAKNVFSYLGYGLMATPIITAFYAKAAYPLTILGAITRLGNFYADGHLFASSLKEVGKTALEIAYFANTFFDNPIIKIAKTSESLFINAQKLLADLRDGENKDKILKDTLAVLTNTLQLTLLVKGGTEIKIALKLLQIAELMRTAVAFHKTGQIKAIIKNVALMLNAFLVNLALLMAKIRSPAFSFST